ncbi:MAG: hypothetical protein GXY55_19925 [Phycisphaerae bacterium]|nr:hypothetical protein [Phycisphaerae bacterium]
MRTTATFLTVLLVYAGMTYGYLVEPALSLDKLTSEADVIFKGTAVSSGPAQDDWFKPYGGFIVRETQFKIISIIKGDKTGDQLIFRHYDEDRQQPYGRSFEPQHYHFESGKAYVVFAKRGGSAGIFRQLWMYHKIQRDQGVVRCADTKPVAGKTTKEVLWRELTATLTSDNVGDAVYALGQLDQMSAGDSLPLGGLSDFDRKDVLAAVQGLMVNRESNIAQAAIGLVGSHNPYMSDERTLHWLTAVGSAKAPGIGAMDPKMGNLGGGLYWKDLVALADGKAPDGTRTMAIRALGLAREPSLKEPIGRWLTDSSPAVRASAVLLLADFPGPEASRHLTAMGNDPAPNVRRCVAHAIGFAQQAKLANVLVRLLADNEFKVRQAAAMSLLSFSPKEEAVAAIFRANLENEEFKPLFLVALAHEEPAEYLDALATAVERKTEPKQFWGGQIPAFTAWEILFRFLQARSGDEIRSGKFNRYLDAMEKVGNYSSSEPRDIYAFYVQRGMNERAQTFRQEANKAASYDLDYFFKQVDANPSAYKRQ